MGCYFFPPPSFPSLLSQRQMDPLSHTQSRHLWRVTSCERLALVSGRVGFGAGGGGGGGRGRGTYIPSLLKVTCRTAVTHRGWERECGLCVCVCVYICNLKDSRTRALPSSTPDLSWVVGGHVPDEGLSNLVTEGQQLMAIVQAETHVPDVTVAHLQSRKSHDKKTTTASGHMTSTW